VRLSIWLSTLALCASLPAGELLTPGEQVQRELSDALAKRRFDDAVRLLGEVGGLYRYPASQVEARALLALAASATRSESPAVAQAALRAVGGTGAEEAAAILKPFLRSRDPLALSAVQAAGRLRHESLIPPLLDLAKSAADATVADQALFSLGAYASSPPSVRRRVTERVLSLCQSISRNRQRWRRLRAPGLRALQRLMGRRLNSVQQFTDWWKFAKGKKDPFTK
jgi:HEAT repeat protein